MTITLPAPTGPTGTAINDTPTQTRAPVKTVPGSTTTQPTGPAATTTPAASTTPASTTPSTPTTVDDANGNPIPTQDATALISSELTSWGFGSDAVNWVTGEIQSNKGVDQILNDLRAQPFYVNSIFGQVNAARQAKGLGDMTEAQILAYQDYAVGDLSQAGIPQGFLTQNELVQLMGGDVSTSELDARVTQGFVDATKADSNTKSVLANDYGVDIGNLAAYYLDPTKALPLLQSQFAAAQIGGAALRTGYGSLSADTLNDLAAQGITPDAAQTGFSDLGKQSQLFNPLPGSNQAPINQQVQLAAEFGGDAADQQAIKSVADQRVAAFAGNYKFAETAGRGITGLGPAPQNG